jgi:hypothetical protein
MGLRYGSIPRRFRGVDILNETFNSCFLWRRIAEKNMDNPNNNNAGGAGDDANKNLDPKHMSRSEYIRNARAAIEERRQLAINNRKQFEPDPRPDPTPVPKLRGALLRAAPRLRKGPDPRPRRIHRPVPRRSQQPRL